MSISVSIIEDDADARQILAGWINQAKGFRCVGKHGTAASALLNIPQEKPDIVLVDINLPDLTGIQCVERLKPLLPGKHFVILTVYEDTDHIFEALAVGATGYLLKESGRDKLIASLKEVQAGKFFKGDIVTEITKAGPFYKAEDYHQQYFEKNGGECHVGPAAVHTTLAADAAKARK